MPKDNDLVVSVKVVYDRDYTDKHFFFMEKDELYEQVWNDIKKINSRTYKL